ncbi:hypothetical protein HELRODRAFT_175680 [Helobdella robusta]|uniref:CARD domain-containing protein n=1 Tax=Helobdella robusta TaxID=6412 RepID=T1F9I7_HELRO|nr:hypothetical protein HELRODRAFT_175680 [Helobdella robusta]ESO00694.1 hypothetical protein HELRODRAFT_175680 [Helobdella robusta]
MDVQEKKVIRWKRDLLSANLTWDEATIRKLKSYDLIWDALVNEIEETEMKNCEKIWKYLEHLMRAKLDKNVFNVLCEFLDEENPWISSELRVELSLERGQLKIDDYIKNEASTLVHRLFGTTKRLSEGEKRQLEQLLAVRTQCTKNIWIKNVEQTKQALTEQIALAKHKDAVLKGLIRKIHAFINQSRSISMASSRGSIDTEDGNSDESTTRYAVFM